MYPFFSFKRTVSGSRVQKSVVWYQSNIDCRSCGQFKIIEVDSTTLPQKASFFCCPPKKSIWLLWVVPCFPGSTPSKCWAKFKSHDSHDVSPRWNPARWIYTPGPLKAGILPANVRKAPFHRAKATAVKPRG